MKKSYLMIAAAAALFAACSSNDSFKDIDTQESAISFTPFAEKVTKAAIGSKADLATPGFKVFGYKTIETDNLWSTAAKISTVFNGIKVYSEDQGANWKYTGLRFWDRNATYNFYAVAPAEPTGSAEYEIIAPPATNYGKISISNVQSAKSTDSNDFLIDRDGAKGILGKDHTNTSNTAVGIDFHHIMAKVSFALKSTLTSGKITVSKLTLTGWNNAVGAFAQDLSITGSPNSLVHGEWTLGTAVAGDITLVGAGSGNADGVELICNGTSSATTDLNDWYIMVPQEIAYTAATQTGLTFTVTYTYNDGAATDPYIETFTDQVAVVEKTQIWGTDSHTKYTLDIKPAEIKFNVTQICNFDVDGDTSGNNGTNDPVIVD